MKKTFIFTEAYNCGKIARVAIESFLKFHRDTTINVFGKDSDFKEIGLNLNSVNYIDLEDDVNLESLYKNGHDGTAYIFASVLLKKFGEYERIIHFDSDVLFREECISDIEEGFNQGYHLIGQRRNYEKNRPGIDSLYGQSLKGIPDTIGTCFFGMSLNKLTIRDFEIVRRMCLGKISLTGEPILDFFDPVSFHVMHNSGKVLYLPSEDYGGGDSDGNWDNGFHGLNLLCDFGKKLVHFAGVGSGLNFTRNGAGNVPASYSDWAVGRYNLYSMIFYGESDGPYDAEAYLKISKELDL